MGFSTSKNFIHLFSYLLFPWGGSWNQQPYEDSKYLTVKTNASMFCENLVASDQTLLGTRRYFACFFYQERQA